VRRFGQALVLATECAPGISWLHAHFLHTPASVARYAAMLTGLPLSISAHAKDIWTTPDWEATEKLEDCRFAVTCTAAGAAKLNRLTPNARVDLVYHGLDLARFPPPAAERPMRNGNAAAPVTLLSVGRLVEKKGYEDLLRALSKLPADLHWRFRHIGDGPLRSHLLRLAGDLGVANLVTWLGAEPQGIVLAELRQADLFVLASRIAKDGDRDGLPNVLMEAASQELASVATRVSGIPELIEDGVTGVLVTPNDRDALGRALDDLIRDPARRLRLGRAARVRLERDFASAPGIARIAGKFAALAPATTPHSVPVV
jgi:glycosyltransferase involved in cell wall biosynthesis